MQEFFKFLRQKIRYNQKERRMIGDITFGEYIIF